MIRETMGYGNVFYVFMDEHSYSEGNCGDHFLTFFKKRGAVYTDWDKRREAVDFVHEDARGSEEDWNRRSIRMFAKIPSRSNISLEGSSNPYWGDVVRRSIWVRAIGGHHILFHNDELQETKQTGVMVYDSNVQGGKKDKILERLDWLGHASRFFNNTIQNLDSMAPHNELISSAKDTYCLANPGTEYAVYSWSGGSFQLDLSASAGKTVSARFCNPRNGRWTESIQVTGDDGKEFKKPDGKDWVFYAKAK